MYRIGYSNKRNFSEIQIFREILEKRSDAVGAMQFVNAFL